MKEEDKKFIENYEKLLNKGYCDCNEMNCIDNNSPRRILNIVKQLETNWKELKKYIDKEQDRLVEETSNVYYDTFDKGHKVNEDIYDELKNISNKMQELEKQNEI